MSNGNLCGFAQSMNLVMLEGRLMLEVRCWWLDHKLCGEDTAEPRVSKSF